MEIYQYTNKGQRKENQDYTVYKVLPSGDSIFIVADGMGGYSYGDVASHVVGDSIASFVEANIDKYEPQTLFGENGGYPPTKNGDIRSLLCA